MSIVWDWVPILRRVWTPIGEQPIAGVKPQYKWLWLYAFVHPESGENKAKFKTIIIAILNHL